MISWLHKLCFKSQELGPYEDLKVKDIYKENMEKLFNIKLMKYYSDAAYKKESSQTKDFTHDQNNLFTIKELFEMERTEVGIQTF